MHDLIRDVANEGRPPYFVCTASPRMVDGKPTKNPRYLQKRPDVVKAGETYLAEISAPLAASGAARPAAAHARYGRAAGAPQ